MMLRKDTEPYFAPMRKWRLEEKAKLLGAMKSFTLRPEGASSFQSNLKGS